MVQRKSYIYSDEEFREMTNGCTMAEVGAAKRHEILNQDNEMEKVLRVRKRGGGRRMLELQISGQMKLSER